VQTANLAARNDIGAELRAWADEVIDLLSEAADLCVSLAPDADRSVLASRCARLTHHASALIDRGRFFFPNYEPADRAYRGNTPGHEGAVNTGFRPKILDLVFLSFKLLRSIDVNGISGDDLRRRAFVHLKRVFLSAVQHAIKIRTPDTVEGYEQALRNIPVGPIPKKIRLLANAEGHGFEIEFNNEDLHR
jgi:hypothetical protein